MAGFNGRCAVEDDVEALTFKSVDSVVLFEVVAIEEAVALEPDGSKDNAAVDVVMAAVLIVVFGGSYCFYCYSYCCYLQRNKNVLGCLCSSTYKHTFFTHNHTRINP
ncbi:hypothetical protein DOY81_012020 [Sarcophaga bullata]|nr:hypothetical protein DOY81_012020 [Sarcophaga bullata]